LSGTERIEAPEDVESAEAAKREEVLDRLREQRPDASERVALKREHDHHLVRETTSERTETQEPVPGMEIEIAVEVGDIYCFTCEEWIGISGVDLRGTPRSKTDAYYLNGPPEAVKGLRERVEDSAINLVETIINSHPNIEEPSAAADFVLDEVDQLSDQLVVSEPDSDETPAPSSTENDRRPDS